MKPLYKDLLYKEHHNDGHVCAFGPDGIFKTPDQVVYNDIVFCDNPIQYDGKYYDLYKDWTSRGKYRHLVAYGQPDEIESIYKDFKCCAFGEIKAYKHINGEAHWNMEDLHHASNLAYKYDCPLYFHFDMVKDEPSHLEKFLTDSKTIPMVWCHAGIWEGTESVFNDLAMVAKLQAEYPNLFIEISWLVLDTLALRPEYLKLFDKARLMYGTDNNIATDPDLCITNEKIMADLQSWMDYRMTDNMNHLFDFAKIKHLKKIPEPKVW